MAKDKTIYIFNGNTYGKGRLVLAVIEQYVCDNPGISKEELEERFPTVLQGSIGVFSSIEEAEEKYKSKRHFVKSPIKLSNATIAVCSQWGIGNIELFLQLVTGVLGYTIINETDNESFDLSRIIDTDGNGEHTDFQYNQVTVIEKDNIPRKSIWKILSSIWR